MSSFWDNYVELELFIFYLFLLQGCSGGINGLAAVLGEPLCKMHELAVEGRWHEALELQRKLVNIDLLVSRSGDYLLSKWFGHLWDTSNIVIGPQTVVKSLC